MEGPRDPVGSGCPCLHPDFLSVIMITLILQSNLLHSPKLNCCGLWWKLSFLGTSPAELRVMEMGRKIL